MAPAICGGRSFGSLDDGISGVEGEVERLSVRVETRGLARAADAAFLCVLRLRRGGLLAERGEVESDDCDTIR